MKGFLLGGDFLLAVNKILPRLLLGEPMDAAEGIKTSWQRSVLLVLAITLHNTPESHESSHSDVATIGATLGFTVMMLLDVALG